MKIFLLLPEFNAGGVERHVLDLSQGLVSLGHEVTVISNGGYLVERAIASGARHISMAIHRKTPFSFPKIWSLRRLFRKESPDIIHVHSRLPAWLCWLAWRGLPRGQRPRLVTTVHGANSVNAYSQIMLRGERVIVVSKFIQDYVLKAYPQVCLEKPKIIYQGVDENLYSRRAEIPSAWLETWRKNYAYLSGKQLLLLPARITPGKGHSDFLKIVKLLVEKGLPVHGLIAGFVHRKRYSFLKKLMAEVRELELEKHVSFLGDRNDLREWMMISDIIYILSSVTEAFGRSVLEGLALGKPIIAYSQGGGREQMERFFPQGQLAPGDIPGVVALTEAFMALPVKPAFIPEEFTISAMCRNTVTLYRELLDSRP